MNYWVVDPGRCLIRQAERVDSIERSGCVSSSARRKLGKNFTCNKRVGIITLGERFGSILRGERFRSVAHEKRGNSGVRGKRSCPSGSLGGSGATDMLLRITIGMDAANATINEELLLTITGVHHKGVIDVSQTSPPVLLFCSINNIVSSKLICS